MIEGRFDVVGAAGPRALFEGLQTATLAHGYLFAGPAGSGKKTFARALAQSLLCVTPKSTLLGYCGICSGCTRVAAGVHPDLYAGEGQVKIGNAGEDNGFHAGEELTARDLVRQFSMHSYAGGRRVLILGDADFTIPAANALLKFFEEPPPEVLLILTSAATSRILPTIRSRLVEVTFAPLAPDEVAQVLEGEGVPREAARSAAALAGGSTTRARGLLGGEGTTREAVVAWFFAALEGEPVEAGWATRPTLEEGLEVVKTLTRDWLVLALGEPALPLLAPDQAERLAALGRRDPASLARTLGALGDAERIARTNVSPALVAELARMALTVTSG